jgi:endonuclease/exonuclease/phosphatase (EEP) superfamily protein YafD
VIFRREFGDYQDAFSVAGWGYGYTKFTRVHGVRIDHVMCDGAWQAMKCWVGPDVGSDHRPVIAKFLSVGELRFDDGAVGAGAGSLE